MGKKISKKTINTALFFTLLIWISYYLALKNGILIQKLTPFSVISVAVFNLLIILISKWLVPAFDAVLKVFAKVGSVIFGAISTIVFFLILTPIGLLLRLHGKQAIHKRYDKKCESYYEEWEPAGTIEKQF
jgi:hypothetical protein